MWISIFWLQEAPGPVEMVVNPTPKTPPPATEGTSQSPATSSEEFELKSEDFPSGDEADRDKGNPGPEEKRNP